MTTIFIVICDDEIESVWDTKLKANLAIIEHSKESLVPKDKYKIIYRFLNVLKEPHD